MITFTESRLQFTFDNTTVWQVVMKVDGHLDQKKTQVLQRFKTADFVCAKQDEIIIIEAKNFTIGNVPPSIDGLVNTIASKVKDTISCSIAANLNSTSDRANWNYLVSQFTNQSVTIKVVFWMEDTHANIMRAKVGANIYGNKLKKKLTWLTTGTNVIVTNTHLGGIPGLVVT
jgi:hypothetical protein